jgi:hypothetical protein
MPNSLLGLNTRSHFKTSVFNLLGTRISGDIGEYTTYTDRYGRKVVFYYTPPAKPPTPAQVRCRARFAESHRLWKLLTTSQKEDLEHMSRALSLPMTGKNVYMSCSLRNKPEQYLTLQRQSGITLPPLTITPNDV